MTRPRPAGAKALIVAIAGVLGLFSTSPGLPRVGAAEDGSIRFEDTTGKAHLDYRNLFGGPGKPYIIESTGNGAAWIDYDGDGFLDLFVVNGSTLERQAKGEGGPGNRLYHNDGKGAFEDVTRGSGLEGGYWGSAVAAGDYDNDGLVDLFVTTVLEGDHLYHNNGNGTFTDVTARAGLGGGRRDSVSAAFFDYDRDGRLDLFVTTFQDDYKTLFHNDGNLRFTDVTYAARLGQVSFNRLSWGTGFQDFDNDGWLDLFVASGHVYPQVDPAHLSQETYAQQDQVLRNLGNGTFADVTRSAGPGMQVVKSSRGVAFGDYDNDGRIDAVVVNMDDTLTLLHNATRNANHWLTLRTIGARSNRDGIGARVRVRAGGRDQVREVKTSGSYASASDPRVHFGLGAASRIESLEVTWPSGARQVFTDVPEDRMVVVHEEEGLRRQP